MDANIDHKAQGEITGDESLRLPLQTSEDQVALPGAYNVVREFNRNTTFLAAGLLGSLIFAALVLAQQEWHSKEQRQTSGNAVVNASPGTLSKALGLNAESSTGELNSGQATSVLQTFAGIPSHENPSPRMATLESTQASVAELTPEIHQPHPQASAALSPSVHRKDSARVIRSKIHDIGRRSLVRLRSVGVKMRLLALWHEHLTRSQRLHSSTVLSGTQNSN
jgi:hypothetical protein